MSNQSVSESILRPCLFLDRDGVIIKNVPYSKDIRTVELMPGIGQLLQRARQQNFLVIGVTNQSGIGRGLLTVQDYHNITDRMLELLQQEQVGIDKIYFSPYYEKSLKAEFLANPHWRKPGIGMFEQACSDFRIDLSASVMIGDRASDLEAAENAGVALKYLIDSEDSVKERGLVPASLKYQFIQNLSLVRLPDHL